MFNRTLLKQLTDWSKKENRKPLIIRGARQVGKTTLVQIFGKQFDQFIHLNLDKAEDRNFFEQTDNIFEIVKSIFFIKNKLISNENTLLFIDEIQSSPQAIKLLRYFFEEFKNLRVIAAGSLLEAVINFDVSFPVGRVEFLYLCPCSFKEFLDADTNSKGILKALKEIPFPSLLHENTLRLFSEYSLIGGMPEIVNHYCTNRDALELNKIYDSLLTSYLDDIEKYAKNISQASIIRQIIQSCFVNAGKRIKYEGFGNTNYKYREIKESLSMLERAMLIKIHYPTFSVKPPITINYKKSPKLMVLDTGLVNYFSGTQKEFFQNKNLENVYEGRIAEHIVGQELTALTESIFKQPTFWTREKKQSFAEVDYVIHYNDLVIPIEVKSGKSGTLRSLMQFLDAAPHQFAVRIFSGKLSVEKQKTIKGKEFYLLNLPFYLTEDIFSYLELFVNMKLEGQL